MGVSFNALMNNMQALSKGGNNNNTALLKMMLAAGGASFASAGQGGPVMAKGHFDGNLGKLLASAGSTLSSGNKGYIVYHKKPGEEPHLNIGFKGMSIEI